MSTNSPPISVQLYSLRDQAAKDFEGVLRRLGDIGFVGVELAGFHDLSPKQYAAIVEESGMVTSSAHVNDLSPDGFNAALDDLQEIGCNVAVCAFLPPERFADVDAINASADALNKAHEIAKELFGEGSHALAVMVAHKIRVAESLESLNEAKANFQKIAEERRSKQFIEQQQMGETIGKLWQSGNKEMAEKSPWFRPDEADPEGSELLAKGFAQADKAFTQDDSVKPEDRVKLHVELRNKAAAHDRLVATVDKLTAERDALRKERDELMDSAPKGDPTTPKEDDSEKLPSELIDKIPWGRR